MGEGVRGGGLLCAALPLIFGCGNQADARPQVLVVVDTNAPVLEQVLVDPSYSADAAIDTLRIDFVGSELAPREIVIPNAADWPVSFGVVAEGATILRLRAFRATRAKGSATSEDEPIAEATIDRVIEFDASTSALRTVRVTLDAGCFGVKPVFTQPMQTCLGEGSFGSVHDGIELGGGRSESRIGQWPEARAKPCNAPSQPGRICVQGGFSILGDPQLTGVQLGVLDSAPLQPVVLKPFWIDENEFTVGRLHALFAELGSEPPDTPGVGIDRAECKWLGPDLHENDEFPLNCISYETARAACELSGGSLPSEARWEHAARGRGQARRFPWGEQSPECCTAGFLRDGAGGAVLCDGTGPERAGFFGSNACAFHDVSRDGILDLGGNVSELTLDSAVSFDHDCWSKPGILRDPVCESSDAVVRVLRGGSWGNGIFVVQSAARVIDALKRPLVGFRCVYEDAP